MYNEPMRIAFVSWPSSGPDAMIAHHEHDHDFHNWLQVEVAYNDAAFVLHYDYFTMWCDHIEHESYDQYVNNFSYRTDQEIAEDSFLFEDDIPF